MLQAAPSRTLARSPAAVEMRSARGRDEEGWIERLAGGGRQVWAAVEARSGRASRAGCSPRSSRSCPTRRVVWVSSSMPIRDVEAYFPQSPKRLRFLANRGANGIDGVVSSAMGAAIATGLPTWVLIGELALQHDAGGLLAARRAGVDLEIVCLNNGGGGIFDFLPVAEHADPAAYEAHIATPSEEVDLAALWPGLREVRTDRRQNVRLHRELVERVAQSL